jgi:uncharacterized RDD family membrane protein YckC
MPMLLVMNATAQASVASISGPTLDNRRVLAGLVDLGIVLAGTVVILFAADALSGDSGEIRGALGAVILGWALYYYFAMESGGGQTVGKKLMNLRVVLADGRPAGMREIAVRTVLRVIDGIGLYIVGLIVMMVTGERRQRLGDLAAGTKIVDASATPYAPPAPVVVPVAETAVEDEAVEPVEVEPVEEEPVAAVEDEVVEPVEPVEPVEVEPVEDEVVEDEPVPAVEDEPVEPVEDKVVEDEPVKPIEDEAVEPVHVALVEDEYVAPVSLVEPVEDEPVPALTVVENVEDEVTPDEPAVPLAIVEDEPVEDEAEEELPEVSSPSLEQLAHDVAAVRTEDEPDEEPMTLKSVETVSAIDLVMGAAEDESSEQDQSPEDPAAS